MYRENSSKLTVEVQGRRNSASGLVYKDIGSPIPILQMNKVSSTGSFTLPWTDDLTRGELNEDAI